MTNKIIRAIQNAKGVGYSGCGICEDKWNWKEPHYFKYDTHYSVFPICEECWQTKSDEEIIQATENLMEQWLVQSSAHYYKQTQDKVKKILPAVRKALEERKLSAVSS